MYLYFDSKTKNGLINFTIFSIILMPEAIIHSTNKYLHLRFPSLQNPPPNNLLKACTLILKNSSVLLAPFTNFDLKITELFSIFVWNYSDLKEQSINFQEPEEKKTSTKGSSSNILSNDNGEGCEICKDLLQLKSPRSVDKKFVLLSTTFIALYMLKILLNVPSYNLQDPQNSVIQFLHGLEGGLILFEIFSRAKQYTDYSIPNLVMKILNRKRKGLNQDQSGAILLTKIRTNKPMRSKTNGNSMQSFVFHGKEKISQSEVSDEEIENIKMEEKSLMKPPKLTETPINILEKNSPSQKSPEVVIYPQSRNLKHLKNKEIARSRSNVSNNKEKEKANLLKIRPARLFKKKTDCLRLNDRVPDLVGKELTVAEISEKCKNILICSMSHELRSPVNHINGILDILKSYIDDEKCLKFINIAMSSTEMLMSKISDILDFSLLETNTCELNPIAFNIRNMLLHIEDILNLQFDHKMIVFNTYVHERVPTLVYYDYKRLKQILINLTYNALKYTKKGFVSVTIDCKPIEGKQVSFTSKLSKGENQ